MKNILIIGGYGNTGRQIGQLLLDRREDVHLIVAGRDLRKAEQMAADLNCRVGRDRARGIALDLSDPDQMDKAFLQADFVVNASSTLLYIRPFLEALLRAKKDGMDTQLSSSEKLKVLNELAPQFADAGLMYIADGGFHPGVPGAMARYAAARMDVLEKADVFSVLKINWKGLSFSPETLDEFVEEFKDYNPSVFRNGAWIKSSSWKTYPYEFNPPFGKQQTVPMNLREMEELPRLVPSLRQTGFFVSGFNPFTDLVLTPLVVLGVKILPERTHRPLARLFRWGLNLSKPPFGVLLVADCAGKTDGEPASFRISLFHEDAYLVTAAPVVACIEQYLDGIVWQAGVHCQANVVDPEPFFKAISDMGVTVKETGEAVVVRE